MVSIKVNGNVQELWPAPCLNIKSTILPFTMINFSIVTIFQLTQHHIRSESSGKNHLKTGTLNEHASVPSCRTS
jgi:hypothetical protein